MEHYIHHMDLYGDLYSHSDVEIIKQIGEKIRAARLNNNITRDELQRITGIHSKTIGDAEAGKNITLATLVAILRGMNMLDMLNELLREESVSPVMMARYGGKAPKRATGKR